MGDRTYTQNEVNSIVSRAVGSLPLRGNASAQQLRSQLAAAIAGGYDYADTLHNIFLDYGYPATLRFFNYWNMYRRFGVARRVIELYPGQVWMDAPEITSSNAAFMRDLETVISDFGLWRRLKGLDVRQRVGRYAGLFMRVRDGKHPKEPIDGQLSGVSSLVDMIPLYESQLEVLKTEDDPTKDAFGQPVMYQFNSGAVGNRNEQTAGTFAIHPSRIIIAAEGADNGSIYGIPALESVYNSLMDLRKILGGGGEGFYKNAAQNIVFKLEDAANAQANAALLSEFNEQYDEFAQNRARRAMWTPGLDPEVLGSNLMGPKEFAESCLMDISAGSDIPVAILIGNQTGRLAGDQDSKGFLSQVQARRVDFGTELTESTIDWMIKWGVLPSAEYKVEWPDAMAASASEKLDNAGKMSSINQQQAMSGGVVPFDGTEIREAAGYESRTEEPDNGESTPDETLDDAEEN